MNFFTSVLLLVAVHESMVTMYIFERETRDIARALPELVLALENLCVKNGRRFGQLVDVHGRILKVVEVGQ